MCAAGRLKHTVGSLLFVILELQPLGMLGVLVGSTGTAPRSRVAVLPQGCVDRDGLDHSQLPIGAVWFKYRPPVSKQTPLLQDAHAAGGADWGK